MTADNEDRLGARARFLADFSHEVRSPLHAIIASAELLHDEVVGELNEEQRSLVGDIHCAAEHLRQLFGNVLDLSRVEMAKLEFEAETLPLAAAVEQALHMARGLAQERNVSLAAAVAPTLAVRGEERRVVQVLNNLLANAIRYSPPGATVTVSAEASGGVVWTSVRDEGPGLDPVDQARIFEPFVALRTAGVEPGAGLGLSVCRSLLRAMGGEIAVKSAPGEGATFRFSLPAGEAPEG